MEATKLCLTKKEQALIVLEEEVMEVDHGKEQRSLIGREVLRKTMSKIWRISKPTSFTNVRGKNLFIITFATKEDKQRIMDKGSWLFDCHLLIL